MPEPVNPCRNCGEHVNAEILATSPTCPHGWEDARPGDLADLYGQAWAEEASE